MKFISLKNNIYFNLITISTIFFLDRISKLIVINLDKNSDNGQIFLSKFLNIQLIWNKGIAFGLLSFHQQNLYNIVTVLIILIIFIILWMLSSSSGVKKYALIMILGGALGNVIDRIIYKAVPDFIDFHVEELHWFIFNVADIFITLGVVFMIIIELMSNNKNK